MRDPPYALSAIAAGAGLAFSSVNRPVMLEITEFSVGLDIIAQRRTACHDGLRQDRFDSPGQPVSPPPADRRGEASRRQPSVVKRLADIDVPEPGDDSLIKQRRLDRR